MEREAVPLWTFAGLMMAPLAGLALIAGAPHLDTPESPSSVPSDDVLPDPALHNVDGHTDAGAHRRAGIDDHSTSGGAHVSPVPMSIRYEPSS